MHIKEKLQTFCKKLLEWSVVPVCQLTDLEAVECGYKKGHTPPEDGWLPLTFMHGKDKHYWIRTKLHTPPAEAASTYLLRFTTGTTGWDATNPQGLLYLNGRMTQGLDTNHMEAFLDADTDYEVLVYFYTGVVDRPFPLTTELVKCYTDVDGLYYDILTPLEALDFLNENTGEYKAILHSLEKAVNLVETRAI